MTGETKVVQFLSVKKKKNMITVSGNAGLFASCHTQKHGTLLCMLQPQSFHFAFWENRPEAISGNSLPAVGPSRGHFQHGKSPKTSLDQPWLGFGGTSPPIAPDCSQRASTIFCDMSSVLASFFSIAHSFSNTLGFKANVNDHFCYAFLRRCHQKCRFVLEGALHGWPFFMAHHLPIIITCSEMPHFPKSSFPPCCRSFPRESSGGCRNHVFQ